MRFLLARGNPSTNFRCPSSALETLCVDCIDSAWLSTNDVTRGPNIVAVVKKVRTRHGSRFSQIPGFRACREGHLSGSGLLVRNSSCLPAKRSRHFQGHVEITTSLLRLPTITELTSRRAFQSLQSSLFSPKLNVDGPGVSLTCLGSCFTVRACDKGQEGVGSSKVHEHDNQLKRYFKKVRPEVHGFRTRPGRPARDKPGYNVLLQAFSWESWKKKWWSTLKTKVEDFSSIGITDVWLPPLSQSVDRQGYLPSQLYNLDESTYGTAAELKDLIDELHLHDICCLADIVINHRSGVKQDSKGHWNIFKGGNADRRLDWEAWAVVDDDVYDGGGKGKHDTGESYGAAPDLDHTNKQVQDELTDWMNWLRAEIGFDGWRFDFVKGYHPKYTHMYIERTKPTFAVGELWTAMAYSDGQLCWDQNRHRQGLCDWIDGTKGSCHAFDFTTKGILQRAVHGELWRLRDDSNKPAGLIGWYPQRAVTFVDNHDTGSSQRHWNFPDDRVLMGYVYILTHPGTPCIFIDHLYDYELILEIKELVQLRKRHRINARSWVHILKAEADIYVAKIDDRIIVKLGSRMEMGNLLPNKEDWTLCIAGLDCAVWETTKPFDVVQEVYQPEAIPTPRSPVEHQEQHPVHLTDKMSEETRNRILREVPKLLDPSEEKKSRINTDMYE